MQRSRWVLVVVVLGLAGALVVPDEVSAVRARARCRAMAFVTNQGSDSVSMIDVKTRTRNPTDMNVGRGATGVAVAPDGKTAFVASRVQIGIGWIGEPRSSPRSPHAPGG